MPPLTVASNSELNDDSTWPARSQFWGARVKKLATSPSKRQRPREPLVLSGHAVSLRIESGTLTIRNGFTRYPQKQELYRYFKGELDIPTRIIMLDGSGTISFDVLAWLSEQRVSLIQINWKGEVSSFTSPTGYAANPFRAKWQIATWEHPKKRMEFCVSLMTKKIEASILTLEKAVRRSNAWEKAMNNAYSTLARLDENPPKNVTELRALEANAAAAYFRAWRGMPIKWRGTSRRPIPEAWKEIGQRTSPFHLAGNRNASHPVNAILNYAYAVPSEPNSDQCGCRWI
jgi:CRISPR/Cas system-associated endonuclease Cas1